MAITTGSAQPRKMRVADEDSRRWNYHQDTKENSMRFLACAALMACIPGLARCAPQEVPANQGNTQGVEQPARSVPTHVLTHDQEGSFTQAEQGDFIEVRLQRIDAGTRSEEHTSELQSLMRISYAVFCL